MRAAVDRVVNKVVAGVARRHCHRLRTLLRSAAAEGPIVQARLLCDFAELHAETDFGRAHGLAKLKTIEDLRLAMPIAGYDRLAPYMDRVVQGETEALLGPGERPIMFAKTSGTTGKPKYIPVTPRFVHHYRQGWNIFGVCVIDDHPGSYLRHIIQLSSPEDEERTPGGVPAGSISGLLARTQKWIIRKHYPAPLACQQITDPAAKYYVTMRMAIDRDPAFITTANPSTTLNLARTVERFAEALIRDVRDGTIAEQFDVPAAAREACAKRLRPNPACADRLQALLDEHGRLLPRHYWRLSFLCNWTGGTLGLYLKQFADYYGDTPVRDIGLLASEGRMSIPLHDGTASGTLDVMGNVYEFVPESEYGKENPPTLLSHELEVGQRYFLVLTNCAGLWRYDIGDLIECTGFMGRTPLIAFLSKGKHTASVTGEKLTEHQVVDAMQQVVEQLGEPIDSFIMAPVFGDVPNYRLNVGPVAADHAQLAEQLDAALKQRNIEYAGKRDTGRLGPVTIRELPADTLTRLDAQLLSKRDGRAEQFKHQYLYPEPGADDAVLGEL